MSSLVIVAIPAEDDYVNKISSEKIPHMTLLFLGEDADKVKNFNNILGFTQHAANQSLMRFGLEVDRRGVLGDELADVLFFSKSRWSGFELINNFRSYLLKNDNIRTAYDSAEQFPEWIPHLTLGTPDSPAKPDERDYPGINYVNFDRIAVWFGEYEGIEFPLKTYDWDSDVAMGNSIVKKAVDNVLTHFGTKEAKSVTPSALFIEDFLSHFGVKGQKWGVRRKATVGPREVIVRDSRLSRVTKRAKTSGGEGHPTHEDAIRALKTGQISKKSGFKSLSNEELQAYTQRLNLEQNAKRLRYQDSTAAKKFVYTLLGQTGKGAAQNVANDASGQLVKKHLYKKIGLAAAAAA